jgi:hypothetical protein
VTGEATTAFGLDIRSDPSLAFLERSATKPTGRTLEVTVERATVASGWPAPAEVVCDERQPDGTPIFRIESHPELGYLIAGPEYGSFILSREGTHLRCSPGKHSAAAWQRLLIAQVLPFAALLRGLEVFHASAIVHDSKAVAFLGPSRVGKSSLAVELCRRGAVFLADDVVSLEINDDELLAHPGTPLAGVDHGEAGRQMPNENVVAMNKREQLVRMPGSAEPIPLGALFFLSRPNDAPDGTNFERVTDPQMLLTATFNFVLATPERLRRLLDVCALAAQLKVERVTVGTNIRVSELADAVEQRLRSSA